MSGQSDPKHDWVGNIINRCLFRFNSLMNTRRKQISRLGQNYDSDYAHEQVQKKLLQGANDYVNCLTGSYKGQVPDYLQNTVSKFKTQLYSELQPAFVLQDTTHQMVGVMYENRK